MPYNAKPQSLRNNNNNDDDADDNNDDDDDDDDTYRDLWEIEWTQT